MRFSPRRDRRGMVSHVSFLAARRLLFSCATTNDQQSNLRDWGLGEEMKTMESGWKIVDANGRAGRPWWVVSVHSLSLPYPACYISQPVKCPSALGDVDSSRISSSCCKSIVAPAVARTVFCTTFMVMSSLTCYFYSSCLLLPLV